jgi:hypothetical protein
MQALATRCCENAELMEQGHYQGSCATPAIDQPPTAVSTSLQLWLSVPASTERSCFGELCTYRNEFVGFTRPFAIRHVQHPRDREEIEAQASLTIKYEFILPSDLPEFTDRADRLTCLLDTKDHTAGAAIAIAGTKNESRPISVWIRERDAHEHMSGLRRQFLCPSSISASDEKRS